MTAYNFKISAMSTIHPNAQVGIYSTTGGDVTYGALASDFTLPYPFVILHIGAGGDIVFEDYEGNAWAKYAVLDGSTLLVNVKKILVTGVVNGTPRSTTCQKITWETAANIIQS